MDITTTVVIGSSILGVIGFLSSAVIAHQVNKTRQHQIVVDAVIKMHQHACEKLYDPMHRATREEAISAYKELISVIKTALEKTA